jgi:preprotein translocase SecE subunit
LHAVCQPDSYAGRAETILFLTGVPLSTEAGKEELKEEMQNSRWVTIVFVICAGVIGLFLNSSVAEVSGYMNVENPSVLGLVPASAAVGVVGAVAGFFALARHPRAGRFTDLVVAELQKVAWPSRDETVNNTMIVIGATLFFSALLAVYDFLWTEITSLFLYS